MKPDNIFIKLLIITLLISSCKTTRMAQETKTDQWFTQFLKQQDSLKPVIDNPDQYKLQIIYTQITRDSMNKPSFKTYRFNLNPGHYFYPASSVKLPIALEALQKLNELNIPGLDKYTPMFTDSVYPGTSKVAKDTTAENALPSVAQYVKKIFLVSDNDAANRLYEFVGQQKLNEDLHKKGYKQAEIIQRLDFGGTEAINRHTNPVIFKENDHIIYQQPEQYNRLPFPERHETLGQAYLENGKIVNEPMSFALKNRMPLEDLHNILKSVIFPMSVPVAQRFKLTANDYAFLYKYMSETPPESAYPHYDSTEFPEAYVKFFMYGADKTAHIPAHIRLFNKPGWAYGFLIDNAYIVDFKHSVEFMLSAVIYVNNNGIMGDDNYELEETGLPFLKNLGLAIYNYELKRKKPYPPDLSRFKIKYDQASD